LNREPGLAKEMAIVGECVDNRIELLIRTIPSLFTVFKLVVKKKKRVPAIVIFLFHGTGIGNVGGVSGESNGFLGVESAEKDVVSNCSNNLCEGGSVKLGYPFPRGIFLKKVVETGGGVGVMGDEFVIEPNDAEEAAEF